MRHGLAERWSAFRNSQDLRSGGERGRIAGQFGSYLLCREQPPNPPAERPGERGTQELGLIRPVAGRGNSAPSPSANLAGVRGSRWCSWSRPLSGPKVGPASPCRQVHGRRMPTMRAPYSLVSRAPRVGALGQAAVAFACAGPTHQSCCWSTLSFRAFLLPAAFMISTMSRAPFGHAALGHCPVQQ